MRATLAAPLALLLLLFAPAASAASWQGSDAPGDAVPSPANEWADLVEVLVANGSAQIHLARTPAPVLGAAYIAIHQHADGWRYCVMVVDRSVMYLVGAWDEASGSPTSSEATEGAFEPGAPALVRIDGCAAENATAVRALALDVKLFPARIASSAFRPIVLDELEATAVEAADAPAMPEEDVEAAEAPVRAVPLPGALLAIVAGVVVARRWA